MDWQSISKTALQARVAQGVGRMTIAQRGLWNVIEVEPVKWRQHPYGDQGGGFWVVAVVGRTVIWYNDIEEGFNRSTYIPLPAWSMSTGATRMNSRPPSSMSLIPSRTGTTS